MPYKDNSKRKIHDKLYRQAHKALCIEIALRYRVKYPWRYAYRRINSRCNCSKSRHYKDYGGRGIKCLITSEEIKILWFRDKAFEMKKPSIHRINNDGNYEINNCKFLEFKEHLALHRNKAIFQINLNGIVVKEWNSISEAANFYNTPISNISSVLRKTTKSACGYLWRYKNE